MIEGFFGVFSPAGELEAVESTEAGARDAAMALSPLANQRANAPNRTVRPVLILTSDPLTAIGPLLRHMADRAAADSARARDAVDAVKSDAAKTNARLPDNYWEDAHRKACLAAALQNFADAVEAAP